LVCIVLIVQKNVLLVKIIEENHIINPRMKVMNKKMTNRWIEEQAKELGLSVCYVKIGGGEDERSKCVCDKR